MHDLYNAIKNLKRSVLSLNYDGYFTRAVFENLKNKNVLDLQYVLRFHGQAPNGKFHYYGNISDENNYDPQKINIDVESRRTLLKDVFEKNNKILKKTYIETFAEKLENGQYNDYIDNLDIKKKKKKLKLFLQPSYCRDGTNSYIDVPLVTLTIYDIPGSRYYKDEEIDNLLKSPKLSAIKKELLFPVLRGIMRFYSNLEVSELKKRLEKKIPTGKTTIEEIHELFAYQEKPDCFQNKIAKDCEKRKNCSYRSNCYLKQHLLQTGAKNHHNISPADPDEVIYQLKEKARELLGPGYQIAILMLDPDVRYMSDYNYVKKFLKYRAVDYHEMKSSCGDFIETVKSKYFTDNKGIKKTYKKHLIQKAETFDQQFSSYYKSKYGETKAVSLKDHIEKLLDNRLVPSSVAHDILRNIVQETTDGITRIVWDGWVSYAKLFDEEREKEKDGNYNLYFENNKKNKDYISYLSDKNLKTNYYMKSLRGFAEGMFFAGNMVIVTPLGYYGQKMGVIFAYKDLGEICEEDLWDKAEIFRQLTLELAPDLFYSLEYEMYKKALQKLEKSHLSKVPDILLQVLPQFLNIEAGAFWTQEQIKSKAKRPKYCWKYHAFNGSEKLYTFSPCKKNGHDSCSDDECPFINNSYLTSELSEKDSSYLYPIVDEVEENKKSNIHNIKCRMLVPVKHEVSEDSSSESEKQVLSLMDGVFDLCFDLSKFVISRYAMDLYREINFVYILVTNAAKQKYNVLQHATRAAVSAIVSRNHSHHIGSHVMPRATVDKINDRLSELYPYLCEDVEKIKEILKNRYSNEDYINVCNDFNEIEDVGKKKEILGKIYPSIRYNKEKLEYVNILKTRLDDYIQKKADFTAEIATQPLTTTKTLRFIDHLFLGFINNTLLMDNIGKNEGVCYENGIDNKLKFNLIIGNERVDVKFECGCEDHHSYELDTIPYVPAPQCPKHAEYVRSQIRTDFEVALPGPLGEYAFFSFLENFIRNGIKHNRKKSSEQMENYEVTIKINDGGDDHYYDVTIYDNHTMNGEKIYSYSDVDDETKQIPCDLKTYLEELKKKDLIRPDGVTRPEAWGMAEMLIMATLLKGSDNFMYMSNNITINEENNYLAYQFKLMRAKKIAIIGRSKHRLENRREGVWCFSSFADYINHIKNSSPAAFEFMLVLNTKEVFKNVKNIQEIRSAMPCRVMIHESLYKDDKLIDLEPGVCKLTDEDVQSLNEDIYNSVWHIWLKYYLGKKLMPESNKPCLVISFDQRKDDDITKSWLDNIKKHNSEELYNLIVSDKDETCIVEDDKTISTIGDNVIAFYDRHGNAYSKLTSYINNQNKKYIPIFYELYDKNASDFVSIFRSYDKQTAHEMIEAAFLKVLILDERLTEIVVQRNMVVGSEAEPYKYDKDKFASGGWKGRLNISRYAGIYIATHVLIDNQSPDALHKTIEKSYPQIHVSFQNQSDSDNECIKTEIIFQQNQAPEELKDIDVLIIHQGVLENFFKNLKSKDDYKRFLNSLIVNIPYVFVDSGRGIPPKLPDHVKFLPFSLLEEYLMKTRISKYSLSKMLMSLYRR